MSKIYQHDFGKRLQENYDCQVIMNEDAPPYCLFKSLDIGKILKLINISGNLRNYNKIMIKCKTNGGEQSVSYIDYDTLCKLLSKSRKVEVIDFCDKMKIDITSTVYTCIEADTLKCIMTSFYGEDMEMQYKINQYQVDLYFPKYKLIVECDEYQHNNKSNKINDDIREKEIKQVITECIFIRYSPYQQDFNIFQIINQIYSAIRLHKTNTCNI